MANEVIVAEVVKRRCFPWKTLFAIFLVMPIVLASIVWRIGWPPKSWETTVTPLEEISWLEAVRQRADCIQPDSAGGSGRTVLLSPGTLDKSGKPIFDLSQKTFIDRGVLALRKSILPELKLPELAGKQFHAGVFWVDLPAQHEGEPADNLDPAAAYSVLLMCPKSERWEQAAQLIVDLNRNRNLTDDPVMELSGVWSHRSENPYADLEWYVEVFDPVELSRTLVEQQEPEDLPGTVGAVPALQVTYQEGDEEVQDLALAFFPVSLRKGKVLDAGVVKDVIITPDRTRFGRFNGPLPGCWALDGTWIERSCITEWDYERGTFWGCTLDADGREIRDGPYKGTTGLLRAETADGAPLQIRYFRLLLRGEDPHCMSSWGWAPIPGLSWFTFPVDEQRLPVGDYEIDSLMLTGEQGRWISVDSRNHAPEYSAQTFKIQDGQTTRMRLPKKLTMKAVASLDVLKSDRSYEQLWSSDPDAAEASNRTLPQPGCEIELTVVTTDPATGSQYTIYPGGSSPGGLQVVIKDESGKVVTTGTMEYG